MPDKDTINVLGAAMNTETGEIAVMDSVNDVMSKINEDRNSLSKASEFTTRCTAFMSDLSEAQEKNKVHLEPRIAVRRRGFAGKTIGVVISAAIHIAQRFDLISLALAVCPNDDE